MIKEWGRVARVVKSLPVCIGLANAVGYCCALVGWVSVQCPIIYIYICIYPGEEGVESAKAVYPRGQIGYRKSC